MVRSQNGNAIQMPLFQSIPSCPCAQEERAGYIFINILDPNYVFPLPETPAKWPQQQVSAPSMLSGGCLHMFTYPALSRIPPAQPTLPSGMRSYQCPTDSCRIPVILAESGAFRRNRNWQRALPILPFRLFPIPMESLHSGIDTGMFPGIHQNGMQLEYIFRNCI